MKKHLTPDQQEILAILQEMHFRANLFRLETRAKPNSPCCRLLGTLAGVMGQYPNLKRDTIRNVVGRFNYAIESDHEFREALNEIARSS